MRRDPYRAQAEKLRQKIERVEPKHEREIEQRKTLPKRSELHQEKRKKIKYPLIKGMLAFFVLLPIMMFGLYIILDTNQNENRSIVTEKVEEVTYETKDIEEKVKSGTSSTEDNAGEETEKSPELKEEPEPAVQEEASSKEVDKENLIQLTEQGEVVRETEYQENVQVIEHVVKPEETLFRIAMNYYNSQAGMEKIKKWNNIENHDLEAGQVLKIPLPVD
ncbi:LysM peptidoglycan-binding domain-containing protein [Bacillus sp. SCS-153A]|uniref:LysM peptidoglycan-binding domain-containing protein n=1 Tax=Rossellomorea sedimentorum TaxID=3115294 RepID=UPI0039061A2C